MGEVIILKDKRLMKLANSYVMVIDKHYIKNGLIDIKAKYNVALTRMK